MKLTGKLMHWTAEKILHDEHLAEDAVHEAFLRIIQNFHQIREIPCPKTRSFVVIIVRNVALNMQKKRKREEKGSFQRTSAERAHRLSRRCASACNRRISLTALMKQSMRFTETKSWQPYYLCRMYPKKYCYCTVTLGIAFVTLRST